MFTKFIWICTLFTASLTCSIFFFTSCHTDVYSFTYKKFFSLINYFTIYLKCSENIPAHTYLTLARPARDPACVQKGASIIGKLSLGYLVLFVISQPAQLLADVHYILEGI